MKLDSLLTITFDGEICIANKDRFANEEFSFPTEFPGDTKQVLNSSAPALKSYGNATSSCVFEVVKTFETYAELNAVFLDKLKTWRGKGTGILSICTYGEEIQFEARITSYTPRMVVEGERRNNLYEEFSFDCGKML